MLFRSYEAFKKEDFVKVLDESHMFFDYPRLLTCLKDSLVRNFNVKVLRKSVQNHCLNPGMFKVPVPLFDMTTKYCPPVEPRNV